MTLTVPDFSKLRVLVAGGYSTSQLNILVKVGVATGSTDVVSFNLAFKTLGRAIVHGTYQH